MEHVLSAAAAVRIFCHWIHTSRRSVCVALMLPHSAACAQLLPMHFSGRGAVGTLFRGGGDFPYTLTGTLSTAHGTKVTPTFVAQFQAWLRVYTFHPRPVIIASELLANSHAEKTLYARIAALWQEGALVFYEYMDAADRPAAALYIIDGSPACVQVDALVAGLPIRTLAAADSNTSKTHLTPLVRLPATDTVFMDIIEDGDAAVMADCVARAPRVLITHWDACILRVMVAQLHVIPRIPKLLCGTRLPAVPSSFWI